MNSSGYGQKEKITMKKKLLALVLAAAMTLSLASCGGSKTETPSTGSDNSSAGSDNPSAEGATYTVGICQLVQHPALDAATQGFIDALNEALPGQVTFENKNASGEANNCGTIVNGFVSEGVDLIMANATAALTAAASATADIPILGTSITAYGVALDLDDFDGTVGGNISGTSDLADLSKQADMITEWFPETKTVDGVTYQFDGWYKDEACTQKANFDGTITQNTTYYAHYVPQSGSLSVSKNVTGSAANVDQSFTFELSCTALTGKTFAAEGAVSSVAFNDQGVATVQLKHGQSVTLTKIPAGSRVAVRETGLSGNARTSSTVSVNNGPSETVATDSQTATASKTVTIASNQTQTLAFTNSAEAVSATGVSLDAGPMAGLFAVAVAGAGALAASGYKRRKREQGAWKE